MKDNSLNPVNQSAYRKHHSTETALIKISNDILCEMDNGKCSLVVMLDQSAAFDTVNLDILMHRLEDTYGISGSALEWLKSYYRGRTQSVVISGSTSKAKNLSSGFPQGSVLGPFQYPTYTAPLFHIATEHGVSMHMYADDTQLYSAFDVTDIGSVARKVQNCITEVEQWMTNNHLKLNTAKTEVLLCGTPHNIRKLSDVTMLQVGKDNVDISDHARNIGAILDSNLSMVPQVNSVVKSCYMKLRQIGQIRPYLTEDATATLVRTLIFSKLDYVNALLIGLPDALIHKLQLIQNNAARLVKRSRKSEHVTPLMKDLHWLPVKQRIQYKVNLVTFKAINGLAPVYIQQLIQVYEPSRSLRSAALRKLVEPRSHKRRSGDRAFRNCAPRLWNNLPHEVTECTTVDSFKRQLKHHLFKEAYNI